MKYSVKFRFATYAIYKRTLDSKREINNWLYYSLNESCLLEMSKSTIISTFYLLLDFGSIFIFAAR